MAASPLQLDFGLTCRASTTDLSSISTQRRMRGKVFCWKSQVASGEKGMPPQEMQECLWKDSFGDPAQSWDKRTAQAFKVPLWLNNQQKPPWVDLHLPALDAGMKTPPESVSTSGEGQCAVQKLGAVEGPLEIGTCRKLCDDGRISDAVDALNLWVQQGCHVDNNLFYRVLKRCIAHNDLVMGRRIHALTIKSGYDGDAFLATHLISLYASHGRLEDAMKVFTKVSLPTVYNWTTIIFAYATHGEAAQAVRLYRQMLESTTIKPDNRLYVAVLKACATAGDLVAGKEVHARILAFGGKPDVFVQAGLVNMYAKCGSLGDARRVFDRLPERTVVTWNALIAGYAQRGMGQEALNLHSEMQQEGSTAPDSVTYICLLQACASVGVGALDQGKRMHAQIEERLLQEDLVLGGSLVNMYAKCGSLGDARRVFDRLPERDVVTWNTLLAGYAQQGMGLEALDLYRWMQQEGSTAPDSVTYVCLLQACASVGVGAVGQGQQLHAEIQERGLQEDSVLGGSLVNMYAKCGSLGDACRVFDRLPERNVVTWNALLAGYAQQGMGEEALSLYRRMQQEGSAAPDSGTYVSLLQACASVGGRGVDQGKQLHAEMEERGLQLDLVLGGSLVNMYAKCGSLGDARMVFDRLADRDVVTWNAMLAGYAQQGMGQEALSLYSSMQHEGLNSPDSATYACLLQACASVGVGALNQGKQLHAEIVEEQGLQEHLVLGGSLVNMYSKCGNLGDARRVFDRLPARDVVTWNALLAGYAQQGMGQEALSLYSSMQRDGLCPPDSSTYACLLQACASVGVGALVQGKELHSEIEEQGLQEDHLLGGSLVNMYAKCGSLGDARRVFDRLPERDVVTWTALIAGYAQQQGMGQEALSLYSRMRQEGSASPDSVTYVCLLQACASVAALALGKQLHAQIEERGLQDDAAVGSGLVNMYAKCGSMPDSQQVFDSLPERSMEAWNALTGGYARQGDSEVVFDLLGRMRLEGVQPDGITFLCVLTVCSHVGEVDKGRKYFECMKSDDGMSPSIEHYTCMMDLLGRAGHLDEALRMAKTMPFPANGVVWLTLLGACRKWKNVEMGHEAFELAVAEDPQNAASYVLMSNIYASAQMWEEAEEMQARRVKWGAWKKPGESWWTDMGGVVHTFVVADKKHAESEGTSLYARLEPKSASAHSCRRFFPYCSIYTSFKKDLYGIF